MTARHAAVCAVLLGVLAGTPSPSRSVVPRRDRETGRIEGTVIVGQALSRRRLRVPMYQDYGAGAPASPADAGDTSELANVVLYLDSVPGETPSPPSTSPAIHQRHETFVPHLTAVLVGTTVEFPNDDPIFHNVFSLSRVKSFDLGRYPTGASKSVRFDRPGVVQVFCHIHSDMRAIVLVLENALFAAPDAAGHYVIDRIPPGTYRLVAWHERVQPITREVLVRAGEVVTVNVAIPLPADVDER